MSEQQKDFLDKLKLWLITIGVTIILAFVGDWFRTTARLNQHEKEINRLEQTMVTRDEYKGHKETSETVVSNIEEDIQEIKETQKEILRELRK